MDMAELLDLAKRIHGSMGAVAKILNVPQTRLSEWRIPGSRPLVSKIAKLAEICNQDVLMTVAEIEAQHYPEYRDVWLRAMKRNKS